MLRPLLIEKAAMLTKIRDFFYHRQVVEVETPLLLPSSNPSPQLSSFLVDHQYLQTSPEFAMKRLIAQGSGDIFQICKAFRKEEQSTIHHPEFTILEWYRLDYNHHQLIEETIALMRLFFPTTPVQKVTYQQLFWDFYQINVEQTSLEQLRTLGAEHQLSFPDFSTAQWIEALFTLLIEPQLPYEQITFVYDFPANQAMLAKINQQTQKAERFEIYFRHLELGNGFHELNDQQEQLQRFTQDNQLRQRLSLPTIPIDEQFIASLAHLPNCAGIAIGLDRLFLLIHDKTNLDDVLPFRKLLNRQATIPQ